MERDSNPRNPYEFAGFQNRCLKPLSHPSFSSLDFRQIPFVFKMTSPRELIVLALLIERFDNQSAELGRELKAFRCEEVSRHGETMAACVFLAAATL